MNIIENNLQFSIDKCGGFNFITVEIQDGTSFNLSREDWEFILAQQKYYTFKYTEKTDKIAKIVTYDCMGDSVECRFSANDIESMGHIINFNLSPNEQITSRGEL